ncbi:sulfite exporter TauE/SafE family protein, partial [Desulfocurvus sp.]|uniref:sulfite exporter TauE/SafE family protein n=1 Tax=Desulfocurvus sp. TaxID=2871698 RepID=UPI0025C4CD28
MFFPTAGIEVAPWVPPLVAFVISFFTSMGGVSGAFLLLPFQMSFLGYVNPSVSATNQLFNVVAIPSGVYRYCKEGRMLWPLTWIVVLGTLPGVFIGAYVRTSWLPDPRHFKMFAAAVLLYIGV